MGGSGRGSRAARGRARRLPGAVWDGQSASLLRRGAGGSSAAHGGLTDGENRLGWKRPLRSDHQVQPLGCLKS